MALIVTISAKELERQAALVYEGETLKVMLCQAGVTDYTAEDTVADWQDEEVSGNGYVRYSEVIGTGSYSGTEGAYLLPTIDADFVATGAGYNYDRVVVYIEGATYPHSIIIEDPNIALSAGQTQTYRIGLRQDD
jgi:hypothetical protein